MNITSVEAELMAIHSSLISAMEYQDVHEIIVITDSITAAKKIFKSHINPLQTSIIPIATGVKEFLVRDNCNCIHFWYCPSKAEWPRHKIVNTQVKEADDFPILPSKISFLFSRKKKCNDILKEWQDTFPNNRKRGQLFLDFEDDKGKVLKPTYTNGGLWLPFVESSNSLCARFTCMTTRHAPISEYRQRFSPNSMLSCLCGQADIQDHKHIVMQCSLYNQDTRPRDITIGSFVHFLMQNPTAFSFDNG